MVVAAERDERNGKGDRRDEPTHHSRGGYIWGAMVVTGICAAPAPARVGGRSAWEPRGGGATGSVTTRGAGDWAGRGGGHMVARHREEEELGGQIASVPGNNFGAPPWALAGKRGLPPPLRPPATASNRSTRYVYTATLLCSTPSAAQYDDHKKNL
jgi:hypothetical protein